MGDQGREGTRLLAWVDRPSVDSGVSVLRRSGWERHPYGKLARLVRGASLQFREAGLGHGDVVAVTHADPIDHLVGLFGAWHAGATVLSAPAPTPHRLTRLVRESAARWIVGPPEVGPLEGVRRLALEERTLAQLHAAPPADTALIHFTSGSTGLPSALRLSRHNVEANLSMIYAWLDWRPQDGAASWLPLHHDMGLIGLFIGAICRQADLWQLEPKQFLERPARWLECFGERGATIGAAPTFGYGYCARRVRSEELAGMDFSHWRNAVVGAERITPDAIGSFSKLLAPRGFRPTALRPAYGLAEATLAVSGVPVDSDCRMIRVDWARIRAGAPVRVLDERRLGDAGDVRDGGYLVSCGRPLDDLSVSVVDASEQVLDPGHVGEITVDGPSVGRYQSERDPSDSTRIRGGRLYTGDAGFLLDGELFVVGRMVDSLKVRGRRVYAEIIESKIATALSIPMGKCVVVPAPQADAEAVAVVLETPVGDQLDEVGRLVRAEVGSATPVVVYEAAGRIPRTTSGKPRRREVWRMLVSDEIPATPQTPSVYSR